MYIFTVLPHQANHRLQDSTLPVLTSTGGSVIIAVSPEIITHHAKQATLSCLPPARIITKWPLSACRASYSYPLSITATANMHLSRALLVEVPIRRARIALCSGFPTLNRGGSSLFDNADGKPGLVYKLIPQGQKGSLLITTTHHVTPTDRVHTILSFLNKASTLSIA